MREIGGYIELDSYKGSMPHENGIKLNCGRCALEYIIKAYHIQKLYFPKLMCDSNDNVLQKSGVVVKYYSIDIDFHPVLPEREKDEWLYLVNYYGQLSNEYIVSLGENIIVDNSQAFFQEPIQELETIYSCRKYFGVADGAILFSKKTVEVLEQDESFHRMNYLLGRYERTASEFYNEYLERENHFSDVTIKRMSRLTENLLHGIDYEYVKKNRTDNFLFLYEELKEKNQLTLSVPIGPFMYPFLIPNGSRLRKVLQKKKIYVPILWPSVFNVCKNEELEYYLTENILPLPIDQRYSIDDMKYMVEIIKKCLREVAE